MNERRSNTICAVVGRPDHHCGDDLVVNFIKLMTFRLGLLCYLFSCQLCFLVYNDTVCHKPLVEFVRVTIRSRSSDRYVHA